VGAGGILRNPITAPGGWLSFQVLPAGYSSTSKSPTHNYMQGEFIGSLRFVNLKIL
jgi:hypothetical protein